jgi:hypothetical protein
MDCATFRGHHASFVDGALSDIELVTMQRHIAECAPCAAHDVAVRRALVVFRSLTPIDPSPDFTERLNNRLRRLKAEHHRAQWLDRIASVGPGIGVFAATASVVIAAGFLVVATFGWSGPLEDLKFEPIVASAPSTPVIMPGAATSGANAGYGRVGRDSDEDVWASLPPSEVGLPPSAVEQSIESFVSDGIPVWADPGLGAPPMMERASSGLKLTSLRR